MREIKYYALYLRLREDIVSGVIAPGARLPSKRALAARYGVSVITAETALSQLADEGYIRTRERSGCFARELAAPRPGQSAPRPPLQLLPEEDPPQDLPEFPYSVWFRLLRHVISEYGQRLVARSPSAGCARLRNAIAGYLLRYRGMYAQPEQIIVGSGSEQLYQYVVRLLGTNRIYGIEKPSYRLIEAVYAESGVQVEPLPMEPDGIPSDVLASARASVLHVTPFHSYPSGATAPAPKRYEYLAWAGAGDRWLVEDDFDSEFFLPGNPPETLWSMDKDGKVLYLNTFSKSLAPSIRIGYMILPEKLLSRYSQVLGPFSCTVPLLEQYALAEFIAGGYFEQHLNRRRRRLSDAGG